jgi:hypothetical protein
VSCLPSAGPHLFLNLLGGKERNGQVKRFSMQLAMCVNKRQLERDGSCGELSTEHYDLYQSLDLGQPHPGWSLYFCWRLQDQFPRCSQCILPRRGAQGFPFTLGLFIELMYPHLLLLSIGRCELECRSSVCHWAPPPPPPSCAACPMSVI